MVKKEFKARDGEEGLSKHDIAMLRLEKSMKLDPAVQILLGDKPYTLVVNNRTAKDILKDTGVNILSGDLTMARLDDPIVMGSVLLRSLQKHHPDMTEAIVDDLLTIRHLLYVRGKIADAISLFLPDLEDLPDEGGSETEAVEGEQAEDPT